MRQDTADLNLETPARLDARSALTKAEKEGLVACLANVDVYVLGAGDRRSGLHVSGYQLGCAV
jgi:hypothetical protein